MFQNVILDGPIAVKSELAGRLKASLTKMVAVKTVDWKTVDVAGFVEQANAATGTIFDGGFLSKRVFGSMQDPEYREESESPEAGLQAKTMLVLVTADVRKAGQKFVKDMSSETAREVEERFFEEYARSLAPEKMVLDMWRLPVNIAAQHLMWALGQPVRR